MTVRRIKLSRASKKTNKKITVRIGKRRPYKRSTVTIQKSVGFAKQQIVRLRFVTNFQLNADANATYGAKIFRANSCYDPDFAIGGRQPKAFDQWAAFYNHYTVLGSKATVYANAGGSTASIASGIMGILLSDTSTTTYTDGSAAMEDNKSRYRVIGNQNGTSTITVRHYYSTKKFFGVKDVRDNQDNYGALVSTNPSEEAYYHVFFCPQSANASPTGGPWIYLKIDYIVLFTGPKDLSES